MLQELQLTNFKSFAGQSDPIPFAPVTILVGANASGKSNVLDAVRFLQGIGLGLSIAEAVAGKSQGGREVHPPLRGGTTEICWAGADTFRIRAKLDLPTEMVWTRQHKAFKPSRGEFQHQLTCRARPQLLTEVEELRVTRPELPDVQIGPHVSQTAFSLLTDVSRQDSLTPLEKFSALTLARFYGDARFLNVQPSRMKEYVSRAAGQLGEHGENLSAVVQRVCETPQQKRQFLHWVAALCAPEVRDIQFDQTATGKVLLQLVERDGEGKRISAESVSDGTLRFMGILAAMFTAPEGSLFLLEEIENGLHPTRVHLLVELLEQFAESRNLQIIGTTHSSQVLLSLSEQALRSAVLFARPGDTAGTITRRLGDLPYFEEVTQKTQIDRLFTTGWLEQAL